MNNFDVTKPVVCLLGLPCSGTTIVAKTIDCIKGVFMINEPIYILEDAKKPHEISGDRLKLWEERLKKGMFDISTTNIPHGLILHDSSSLGPDIRDFLLHSPRYSIGGIKETVNSRMPYMYDKIKEAKFDIHIINFRDPVINFNSRKTKDRDPFFSDVYNYVDSYKQLAELSFSDSSKYKIITHEGFCNNPLSTLNNAFSPFNSCLVEEMPDIAGHAFETKRGNKNAVKSDSIKSADMVYSKVSNEEKRIIEQELRGLYQELYIISTQ